jgi:hypothetical protein
MKVAGSGKPDAPCMNQLMYDLQVTNLTSSVCAPCRITSCGLEHVEDKKKKKKKLHGLIDYLATGGRPPLLKKDQKDLAHKVITGL